MRHELCKTAEVPASGSVIIPFFGRELHVFRTGGRIRAAANVCMHFGGPLECRDGTLVCPWHNAEYDMQTGARIGGPAPPGSKLMFVSTQVDGDALFYVWGE